MEFYIEINLEKIFQEEDFLILEVDNIPKDLLTGTIVYYDRDWYRFNVLQRIHLNYVEGVNLAQASVLAAGLYRPREAALVGLAYIIGR